MIGNVSIRKESERKIMKKKGFTLVELLAVIAILAILVIIAIIPVIETLSVILQVLYFRKTGKRFDEKTDSAIRYEKNICNILNPSGKSYRNLNGDVFSEIRL